MKNSLKKVSMSLIAGTVILGSIGSANAQSLNYNCNLSKPSNAKYVYSFKFKLPSTCNNIQQPTKPSTDNNTQQPTKPSTDNNTQQPTKPSTDNNTQQPTKPSTDNNTQQPTKPSTDNNTQQPTKPSTDNNTQQPSTPSSVSSIESEVVRLVNIERNKEGLAPLKMSAELSNVARIKSQDMADKNYFSHTSPTYGSPFDMMKQFGIKYTTAGENIAKGYDSAQSVVTGWMNSPGHRANIMSPNFGTIGVGYVEKNGTTYWTQMFTN